MSQPDTPLEFEIKKFLKRDAIIYTLFEQRCEELSEYFGNERFGLQAMFREFAMRTNGACTINRIKELLVHKNHLEELDAKRPLEYWKDRFYKKNTSKFEEHFSINYPLLDLLRYSKFPKYHDVFRYFDRDINEPEPIGMPKKEYSARFALEAMKDLYGEVITFEGTYLDLPVIVPRGQMRIAEGSASVVIDFSKPNQEIIDYILKIKEEIKLTPSIVSGFDRLIDEEPLENFAPSADEIWSALRSHQTNDGKGLSTRWADMLFIYDCEQYLINDEVYVKSEIDRYWHQKNPQINLESYGNAYCIEELKDMLQVDFNNEPDEIKAKYTQKTVINWTKYGLSQINKAEAIIKMIESSWNQDSEENKYPHYAGKIRKTTYKNNQTLIKSMFIEGKISIYTCGVNLGKHINH